VGKKKGSRIERFFQHELEELWPDVERNLTQSRDGGVDLLNTDPFNVEIKGGKSYTWKGVRKILDQIQSAKGESKYDIALVNPHYEEPYVLIPFSDFKELMKECLKHLQK